jgi:hypothetical protein
MKSNVYSTMVFLFYTAFLKQWGAWPQRRKAGSWKWTGEGLELPFGNDDKNKQGDVPFSYAEGPDAGLGL